MKLQTHQLAKATVYGLYITTKFHITKKARLYFLKSEVLDWVMRQTKLKI
jgi:hypothetical protein